MPIDGDVGLAGLTQLSFLNLGEQPSTGMCRARRIDAIVLAVPGCTASRGCQARRIDAIVLADLDHTAVDGDVSGLSGLTQLSFLNLDEQPSTGMCQGSRIDAIVTLSLSKTAVDGDVSGLAGLTQLSHLHLDPQPSTGMSGSAD